jgi:hypothetical protein
MRRILHRKNESEFKTTTPQERNKSIETLAFYLQEKPTSEIYKKLALFLVYKTIEANPNITINQLKHLLSQQYFLNTSAVEGAIGALISDQLYGCVSRFQRRGASLETAHLNLKRVKSEAMTNWLETLELEHPEFFVLESPKYVSGKGNLQ